MRVDDLDDEIEDGYLDGESEVNPSDIEIEAEMLGAPANSMSVSDPEDSENELLLFMSEDKFVNLT